VPYYPDQPVNVAVQVAIQRDLLPAGPKVARVVLVDHLGHRHKSPKVTFKDGNPQPATESVSDGGGPVDHGGDG